MKVALVACPSWSKEFPPYNLALLKSILKQHGHEVKIFDFNIDAFHVLKNRYPDINYWEGQNFFYWEFLKFDEVLLPKLDKLMDKWVDDILEYDPNFIGFTIYHTSIRCTRNFALRLKEKDPSKKIMIGGPQCFTAGHNPYYTEFADYIISGEGEDAILEALKCPEDTVVDPPRLVKINELPTPDYEDFDLKLYGRRMGTSLEASRGCTAKCSFCIETHYWSYRSKKAETIVKEMKECKEKYGAIDFRFNDSLVNGNIKEFKRFVELLCEEKLNVRWDGYARINKVMDYDFIKKIKESGNILLSYGIESGSQKVLDDMNKGIKVEDAEQNLTDGYKVGLYNHVNWMVGFPTEDVVDNAKSLAFIYNNRKGISNISPGMTCGLGTNSDLTLNKEKYGIEEGYWWGNFVSNNFKNTAIHRFIRLKTFHIWLNILRVSNGQQNHTIKKHYGFQALTANKMPKRIEYDTCVDYRYLDRDTFASTLYAEYLTFFSIIYRVYGPFNMKLRFDKEIDVNEFGSSIAKDYSADLNFIMKDNNWKLEIDHILYTQKEFDEKVTLEGTF